MSDSVSISKSIRLDVPGESVSRHTFVVLMQPFLKIIIIILSKQDAREKKPG